ncbi:MAG: AAA family ATPase [Candidatus Omnitrophica bacterium]|nr:AAA family ATPase [Candidatus Omnitrophota bacterium]
MMKVISLVNQKGGCGKTTTAVNLAYAFAKRGNRTLLIDLDPQAHATFSLGITPNLTTADLLEHVIENRPFNPKEFFVWRKDDLSLLPASIGLSALENTINRQNNKLEILTKMLMNIDAHFDYCIIDCPPNLGALTLNALVASSYSVVPLGICELSLRGVENLNSILSMLFEHRKKAPYILYLITQVDRRFRYSENFYNKVKEQFRDQLLSTAIRTNIHLREAAAFGKSVFEYRSDSRGAQDYKQLAQEIESITQRPSLVQLCLKGMGHNEVYVVGEFNEWRKHRNFQLKKVDDGTWSISLPLKRGTYRYKFIVDNEWINDPSNSLQENDAFGGKNSILFVR